MCSLVPYTGLDWLEEERELGRLVGGKFLIIRAVVGDSADNPSGDISSVGLPTSKGLTGETLKGLQ